MSVCDDGCWYWNCQNVCFVADSSEKFTMKWSATRFVSSLFETIYLATHNRGRATYRSKLACDFDPSPHYAWYIGRPNMLDGVVIRSYIFSPSDQTPESLAPYLCDECFMRLSSYEYICSHFVCTYSNYGKFLLRRWNLYLYPRVQSRHWISCNSGSAKKETK